VLSSLVACRRDQMIPPDANSDARSFSDAGFFCQRPDTVDCLANDVFARCIPDGEFLQPEYVDCRAMGLICRPMGCGVCNPGTRQCIDDRPSICNPEGTAWVPDAVCDLAGGEVCRSGRCANLCDLAAADRSYVGCEFFAVDLDNAAIGAGRDASAQQYAVVVSNPGFYPAEVTVEIDTAAAGETAVPRRIQRVTVPGGDLEILRLPRREVDGSSSLAICTSQPDDVCAPNESCWCTGGVRPGGTATDCRCRTSPMGSGLNDGTHSALTSNAYRITSNVPVIAYQFNPLDNVGVFSNDASLLLPTSATGRTYTVVSWPQTIANSDNPAEDFDTSVTDEDLRAFLTVVGGTSGTMLHVALGDGAERVVGLEPGTFYGPGDEFDVPLGPFEVLNLETQAFNGDFTGTLLTATENVSVFTGGEASDAPRFEDLSNRRCCADHLEEQLFPDSTLGRRFFIGRTPARSSALNRAFITTDSVGEFNEPEYVRVVASARGITQIDTTLPPPNAFFELEQHQSVLIAADRDFEMNASQPVAVLQVLASQEATGIQNVYPGGDPSIIAVPPVEQYRSEYVFLTPLYYAFDFVTIVAAADTLILLDEEPLDPARCSSAPADGIVRMPGEAPPAWLVYRCQLSFPDVIGLPNVRIEAGDQDDGYHTLRATDRVSIVVSGFDRFVSYAYAGGLNLDPIE
jgi:hypothetical protein